MLVLDPLGGTVVQANIRCTAYALASGLGSLLEDTSEAQLQLPLLDLVAPGKDQDVLQGQLLPALGLSVGQQTSQGTLGSTPACLHPPTAYQV